MLHPAYIKKIQDSRVGPADPAFHGALELPLDPESQGETGEALLKWPGNRCSSGHVSDPEL